VNILALSMFLPLTTLLCIWRSLEAQTEVEELKKEIEGLRKKVQEAEKVQELSNMLQESHRQENTTDSVLAHGSAAYSHPLCGYSDAILYLNQPACWLFT